MSDGAISTTVRQLNTHVSVIEIGGSVTRASDAALTAAYHEASSERTRAVILDFTKLDYMNSSGIGLLVTLLVRAQRNNQQLYACGLTPHYADIFTLTRLNEAIHIHADIETALAAASAR